MEGKFKLFVIIALVVLALAIGGSTFFVWKMFSNNTVASANQTEEEAQQQVLKPIDLGDSILTNIATESGNVQHFAKVQVSIGVNAADEKAFNALSEQITANAASVRNELISTVGEQTYTMLNATNGKEKLADEIISRLNTLLDTDMVCKVYFQEYFIQ